MKPAEAEFFNFFLFCRQLEGEWFVSYEFYIFLLMPILYFDSTDEYTDR